VELPLKVMMRLADVDCAPPGPGWTPPRDEGVVEPPPLVRSGACDPGFF